MHQIRMRELIGDQSVDQKERDGAAAMREAWTDSLLCLAYKATCMAHETTRDEVRTCMLLLQIEMAGRAGVVAMRRRPWLMVN